MAKGNFLNILFLTSEAIPFAKTGGLGDVCGILPKVLAKTENVSLIMPDYMTESIKKLKTVQIDNFSVQIGDEAFPVIVNKAEISRHFFVFFISYERFFGREFLYGDSSGDYPDNFIRFLFFQKAVLEFISRNFLHFDIIHCNDWQTALMPMFVKLETRSAIFNKTKVVFSIHNLGYQGIFSAHFFKQIGLPDYLFSSEYLEFYGKLNCIKAGIIFSDWLITVSPSYAEEITSEANGFGLEGLLKKFSYKLSGILNGVDYSLWNPETDPFIDYQYSLSSLDKKILNKQKLYAELGVIQNKHLPLIIAISRISEQKGMELLLKLLPSILKEDLYFIFLGVGNILWTEKLRDIANHFSDKMTFLNIFDEKMAHRLEAAADILFMPSVYEPCGLNQIYSLKYGTVPIVRATGGLEDSVQAFDEKTRKGTGFKFKGNDAEELMMKIKKVLGLFQSRNLWMEIQKNGMDMDFSWENVVPQYLDLYKKITVEVIQHG
jgi:starch synthase